jgi:hypothetical protein
MIPQKCEKIGRFASPRAATRLKSKNLLYRKIE